jgi:hypothetical protein
MSEFCNSVFSILPAAHTSIFFKEAAQFDFFNNEEIDSIEFEISW